MRWISVVVFVMCATVASAQPTPPADPPANPATETPPETPAQAAFREGRALLDEGKPDEACAKFEASIRDDPDAPGTMLNLGLCNELLGRTATALRWFRKAQFRAAEHGQADNEAAAKQKTISIAPTVPAIRVELANPVPPGTTYSLDGTSITEVDLAKLEVDPGSHTVELRMPGKPPLRADFTIANAETKIVKLAVPASKKEIVIVDHGKTQRIMAYALGGVGLGLYAGALTISLVGKSRYDALEHPQDRQYWTNVVRFGGTSMFIVGTAALAGAAYLYVRAPAKERIERTVLAPVVGPSQVGVAVHGSF